MDRVRVVDREACAQEAVHGVALAALDVRRAEVVDDDLDAVLVDRDVLRASHVVERHAVLHSGAAATADENTERQLGVALLGKEVPKTSLRGGGECAESLFDHFFDVTAQVSPGLT